jgi:adenylate kinase
MSHVSGIVLIKGLPGVGKTTFLRCLKQILLDECVIWNYDEFLVFKESIKPLYRSYRQHLFEILKKSMMNSSWNEFPSFLMSHDESIIKTRILKERLEELQRKK